MNPTDQLYVPSGLPGASYCTGCGSLVANYKTFEHNEFHRRVEPKENSDA